jgi:hypothetical protein
MTTTEQIMSAREFFDYLIGRHQTHDLALQLVYVYDRRARTAARNAARAAVR